ncbi:hypothetical protein IRT45_28820 [Nocardia sp. BSTN01]|uniref:hypothetical protein n=1 Tax=Nocardia sp. BSTN01 TaxID=2783665 RepID=UPI00188F26A8|nr:hypothetical protein [Nocardia sp. BSTN01]MBF5001144.1 hypothetical protein [Nocardia sp. BSTN01]
MTHAWAAPATSAADVLTVFTPGIERFDYFRLGDRIRQGLADPAEIVHGEGCGHVAIPHDDHVDYLHDGHRHAAHDGHYDER